MEVEALHPAAAALPRRLHGFALQGPNASMEFTMLEAVRKEQEAHDSVGPIGRPLLRALLRPPMQEPPSEGGPPLVTPEAKEAREAAESVCEQVQPQTQDQTMSVLARQPPCPAFLPFCRGPGGSLASP